MRGVVVLIVALFGGSAVAQCENGQCRMPVRSVLNRVQHVQPVRSVAKATYQTVGNVVQSYGSNGSSAKSYGCTGSAAVSYGSSGSSVVSYGSSGSSAVESLGFKQRRSSRAAIIAAAEAAHAACTIDSAQLQAVKLAARSPRMLARMEDLALSQAQASGAYALPLDANGDVVASAVDWDGLIGFIEKILPLILKLIEMFA